MSKPDFIKILVSSLFFDLILLFLAPFTGYAIYLIFLILMLVVPLYVVMGLSSALNWVGEDSRSSGGFITSLSRLVCGSSLVFLLVATAAVVWGELPRHAGLLEVLGYVYLMILLMRMSAAALGNVLCSLVCLVLGKKLDRLSALSGLLCSAAGLQICRDLFQTQSGNESFLLIFSLVNFGYGLVWGGAAHWLLRELSTPDEVRPE